MADLFTRYEKKLIAQILKTQAAIRRAYGGAINEITLTASKYTYKGVVFDLKKYPQLKAKIEAKMAELNTTIYTTLVNSIEASWQLSNDKNNILLDKRLAGRTPTLKAFAILYDPNAAGLKAFIDRTEKGLNLSKRVFKGLQPFKMELEKGLALGISEGKSARAMATELKKYLNEPDRLYRRVRDDKGKLQLSKKAKAYKPGRGVYRSAFQNALRLTATETNIAYRTSDHDRWQKMPIIKGIEVKLSNNHPTFDVCDSLVGEYPKDFKFVGFHPRCYSDKTEVLTNTGWKLFKDVVITDEIFSLNPVTKQPEYSTINQILVLPHSGDMVRFSSRNLDILVTPDHPMKYLNKANGETFEETTAAKYSNNNGALYRSSKYTAPEIKEFTIGEHMLNFDLYVEFMAYYLSEGSLSWTRLNQLHIAQSPGNADTNQFNKIKSFLEKLPFKFSVVETGFYIRDKDMYEYLKQFGKSPDKHVPRSILDASPDQIRLFLNAYVTCDGHTKVKKSFTGSRGGICTPNNDERVFFTTSVQMAADLGEMLVKVGKRPSYKLDQPKGKVTKFKNGTYASNNDHWKISECHSETATTFKKTVEQYTGFVYDLELSKNHIMYVRLNGKCVWGSNCLCYSVPITVTDEEFDKIQDFTLGLSKKEPVIKGVEKIPDKAAKYMAKNAERIGGYKNRPYFVRDNDKYLKEYFNQ